MTSEDVTPTFRSKKVRTGEITKEDFQATIKEFVEDILSEIIQLEQAATFIGKCGLSENLRTLVSV